MYLPWNLRTSSNLIFLRTCHLLLRRPCKLLSWRTWARLMAMCTSKAARSNLRNFWKVTLSSSQLVFLILKLVLTWKWCTPFADSTHKGTQGVLALTLLRFRSKRLDRNSITSSSIDSSFSLIREILLLFTHQASLLLLVLATFSSLLRDGLAADLKIVIWFPKL